MLCRHVVVANKSCPQKYSLESKAKGSAGCTAGGRTSRAAAAGASMDRGSATPVLSLPGTELYRGFEGQGLGHPSAWSAWHRALPGLRQDRLWCSVCLGPSSTRLHSNGSTPKRRAERTSTQITNLGLCLSTLHQL